MLLAIAFTVADALLDAVLMATRCVSLLRMSCCVFDVLFSLLCISRHFRASAACLVDTWSCTVDSLTFFAHAVYAAGVCISVSLRCLSQ